MPDGRGRGGGATVAPGGRGRGRGTGPAARAPRASSPPSDPNGGGGGAPKKSSSSPPNSSSALGAPPAKQGGNRAPSPPGSSSSNPTAGVSRAPSSGGTGGPGKAPLNVDAAAKQQQQLMRAKSAGPSPSQRSQRSQSLGGPPSVQRQGSPAPPKPPGGFGPNAGAAKRPSSSKGNGSSRALGDGNGGAGAAPTTMKLNLTAERRRSSLGTGPLLTPRSALLLKKNAARKLQSAFRRRAWSNILSAVGRGAGGCFCRDTSFRPLVGRDGEIRGVRGPSGRWYVDRAFGILSPHNPIRQLFIRIIEASWFDNVILLAILVNCCVLAVSGRPATSSLYVEPSVIQQLEYAFVWIFTGELACKAIAMGIFTDPYHALLSDPWNRIDLLVVLSAWAPLLFPHLEGYTSLRALRAFRPLRAAHMLPGVRKQIDTIAKAVPRLANVLSLVGFVMIAFAILGMQLFKGQLLYRCYDERAAMDRLTEIVDSSDDALLSYRSSSSSSSGGGGGGAAARSLNHLSLAPGDEAPLGAVPIDPGHGVCHPRGAWELATCSSSEICLLYGTNPGLGTISFDNIFNALMTVFMCVNGEGWTEVMYATQRSNGGPVPPVYFIVLTLFGSFYIVNLFLAVLWETFHSLPAELTPEQQMEKKAQEAIRDRDPDQVAAEMPLLSGGGMGSGGLPLPGGTGKSLLTGMARVRQMVGEMGRKDGGTAEGGGHEREGPTCTQRLARLLQSRVFRIQIMLLIGANTALMMVERHPMPAYQKDLIEYGNYAFFAFYVVEMVLKLCAFGMRDYWAEPFNIFDGIVVLLSAVEIVVSQLNLSFGLGPVQVLRALRLLRIFKLAREWQSLYVVIRSLMETLLSLRDLLIVLLLILFVFALLGMQLFGGQVEVERKMFDTIEHAMMTAFVTVTGEQWPQMWRLFAVELGMWTGVYFVVLVAIGDYVILNLVIAIVIGEVMQADRYVREANDKEQKLNGVAKVRNRKMRIHGETELKPDIHEEGIELHQALADEEDDGQPGCFDECAKPLQQCLDERHDHSCFLFGPSHPVRNVAGWLLRARLPGTPINLEGLVVLTIIFSSAAVALDRGCHTKTGHQLFDDAHVGMPHWLVAYLSFATIVSLIEIGAKIIRDGFISTPNAYIKQPWNQLDACIAAVCVAEFIDTGMPTGLMLRSIHVLRPIRLIARLPGLQKVVLLFYEILPRVGNILLVYCLFLVIFAVLGIQFFAGKFGECSTDTSYPDKASCVDAGERWVQSPHMGSFDNIFSACLLLFEISSLEGWPTVMYRGIDAVGIDEAGVLNYAPQKALFFIAWVFMGGFVVLNVFVGVLIDTFADMEMKETFGGIFTSHKQQHWIETLHANTAVRPIRAHREPAGSACRKLLYRLVTSHDFEHLIVGVILFNTGLMMFNSYGASEETKSFIELSNDLCTVIFVVEAVLKLCAHGVQNYFAEGWNVFDFLVVVVAVSEKVLDVFSGADVKGSLLRVARLARAARVLRTLRLAHSSRAIQSLLMTLLYSVPALVNILSIFTIVMFVYAVLGMELFGGVMYGEFLNEAANFCVFPRALLTMFRCATGEDWNGIMHDAMVGPEDGCDPELGNCGSWMAIPFFVSYIILTTFVVLKIMIALIIENYKLSRREDERLVRTAHRDAFVETWAEFDPDAKGVLSVSALPALIRKLEPPLGPDPREYHSVGGIKERDISRFIISLDIPAYDDKKNGRIVVFHELLLCLTTRALDHQRLQEEQQAKEQHAKEAWGHASKKAEVIKKFSAPPAGAPQPPGGGAGESARPKSSSRNAKGERTGGSAFDKAMRATWAGPSSTSGGGTGKGSSSSSAAAAASNGTGGSGAAAEGDGFSDEIGAAARAFAEAAEGGMPNLQKRRSSVTEETDLSKLSMMFRERLVERNDVEGDVGKFLRSSMAVAPNLARALRRGGSTKVALLPQQADRPHSPWRDEEDEAPATEEESTLQMTSASDEIAVMVIQRRWRAMKTLRMQRVVLAEAARASLKKSRSAPAAV